MERRENEFHELQQSAMNLLAEPASIEGAPSMNAWSLRLRLWHFPASGSFRSWSIFRRGGVTEKAVVRRVTWDRLHDVERMFMPLEGLAHGFDTRPTITHRDANLDVSEVEFRLASLVKIQLLPFAEQPVITGGETFGIAGHLGVRLEWPCEGAESWGELVRWQGEALVWLESSLEPR